MSWFKALKPDSLRELFIHELKTAYDMEQVQLESLEMLAKAATDEELRTLLREHHGETVEQLRRIGMICDQLGTSCDADTNAAARGIAKDAGIVAGMGGDEAVRDAAIILAAQSAEHLEIARYGTLRTWARYLGREEIVGLLQRSLEEEVAFDERLTALAESGINIEATL